MLTESQIAHFRTFGFVVLPNLFSENETETMVAEFELGREVSIQYGNSIADKRLTQWSNTHPEFPFIAGMLEDQRFCSAAEQLLEKGFVGAFANSNRRGGDTAWHPDHSNPSLRAFKFTTYLQPLRSDTGALRFIPGSHLQPFHNDVNCLLKENFPDRLTFSVPSELNEEKDALNNIPSYPCETNPGDVVAFDMRIYHAAQGGSLDRRQLTFCYIGLPRTPDEVIATQEVSEAIAGTHRGLAVRDETGASRPHYHPDWIANPTGSPMRQHWIDKLFAWEIADKP